MIGLFGGVLVVWGVVAYFAVVICAVKVIARLGIERVES